MHTTRKSRSPARRKTGLKSGPKPVRLTISLNPRIYQGMLQLSAERGFNGPSDFIADLVRQQFGIGVSFGSKATQAAQLNDARKV